jgi:hypothetical protein
MRPRARGTEKIHLPHEILAGRFGALFTAALTLTGISPLCWPFVLQAYFAIASPLGRTYFWNHPLKSPQCAGLERALAVTFLLLLRDDHLVQIYAQALCFLKQLLHLLTRQRFAA